MKQNSAQVLPEGKVGKPCRNRGEALGGLRGESLGVSWKSTDIMKAVALEDPASDPASDGGLHPVQGTNSEVDAAGARGAVSHLSASQHVRTGVGP